MEWNPSEQRPAAEVIPSLEGLLEATALLSVSFTKQKIWRLWRPKHNSLVKEALPFLMDTQRTLWPPQSTLRLKGSAVLESREAAAALGPEQNLGCLDLIKETGEGSFPSTLTAFRIKCPLLGLGRVSLKSPSVSAHLGMDPSWGKKMKYSEANVPNYVRKHSKETIVAKERQLQPATP